MSNAIDKIKKLLALTKSTNKHEAANAAARAAALMLEHKIAEADLTFEDGAIEEVGEFRVGSAKNNVGWKGVILVGLFHAFQCWGYKASRGWAVIGTKSDVDTVRYMFDFLVAEVTRLANEGWEREQFNTYDTIKRWKNAFRVGAAGQIQLRLTAQKETTMKEAKDEGKSTALIYLGRQEQAVAAFCKKRGTKYKSTGKNVSASSQDGYTHGRTAGQTVSFGNSSGALQQTT
jgi:Protein of unknown function (DUF2786)